MIDPQAESDVLLGFVSTGTCAVPFLHSLFGALSEDARRASNGHRRRLVEYTDYAGPYITSNRCNVVRYFLEETEYQWLWFVDHDMEFPRSSLYQLLEAAEEKDIKLLGAAYWNKYQKSEIYLSWLAFTSEGIKAMPTLPEGMTDPIEVTALGMGCTLIHRDVCRDVVDMQRATNPDDPWDSFGQDLLRYDDGTAERMGEDVTFCLRARKLGYLAYGLPTLVAEHYKAIFMPHGGMHALHDLSRDAGGGSNGAYRHDVQLVPEERT